MGKLERARLPAHGEKWTMPIGTVADHTAVLLIDLAAVTCVIGASSLLQRRIPCNV